jgi:hypothetical protein
MTLKYMQGFETMRDDSDLRAQGWAPNPSKATTKNVALIPSVTSLSGISLRPMGPFQSPISTTANWGAAAANDFGYFNTGITVNQAWNAGGVTLGFGAKFNSGSTVSYGSGSTSNPNQTCFDGTRYWAIQYNTTNGTYNICYSTNLQTWTLTPSQPSATIGPVSTINYMGGGVIAVIGNPSSSSITAYYTSNLGSTWSSQVFATSGGITSTTYGTAIGTGNSIYPHIVLGVVYQGSYPSYNIGNLMVGTLGGTMTAAIALVGVYCTTYMHPRVTNGLVLIGVDNNSGPTTTLYTATASSTSLNQSSAWSTATLTNVATDIAYNPNSNLWVYTTTSGIYSFPNTGAVGTAVAPTGSVTCTQRYSTVGMTGIYWTGTQMVAVGQQGHIVTSPDGITWTETSGHILSTGVANTDWRSLLYDGSQYVLFSDSTSGVVATTPDLVTNYVVQYAQESAEVITSISSGVLGSGLISGGAPSATTGQWALTAGSGGPLFLQVGPASAGSRPVALDSYEVGGAGLTGSVSTSSLYHYYELHYVKAAGTNSFTCSLYVDSNLVGTSSIVQISTTSDTTSLFVIAFQRNGVFTAFDDIYVTLDDGVANTNQGPLGIVNIVARRPNTDVQDQWTAVGSAGSNSLSADQSALSSQSSNYVQTYVNGNKDIYSSTNTLPANYNVKAVSVEGYFAKGGTSNAAVNLGLESGSVEVDTSNVTLISNTPTYVSNIVENDPNVSAAWTPTTVVASKIVINKVS